MEPIEATCTRKYFITAKKSGCKAKAVLSLWASFCLLQSQKVTRVIGLTGGLELRHTDSWAQVPVWHRFESDYKLSIQNDPDPNPNPVRQEAVRKVNFKAVKGACWGSTLPSSPCILFHPPSPTCPVKLIGICCAKSSMLGVQQASSNGSPRLPPAGRCHGGTGRENNAVDLSEELSVRRALGQRQSWHHPALGPRCTALWWKLSEWANQIVSFQEIRRDFFSPARWQVTNWWQSRPGRKEKEKEKAANKVSMDLFNMSDRRGCGPTWGPLQRFVLHFGEFFSSSDAHISKSQKRFWAGRISARMKWS